MTLPADAPPEGNETARDLSNPDLVLVTWSTDLADGNDRLLLLAAWLRRRGIAVDVLSVARGPALRRFRRTVPTFVANPWPAAETRARSFGLGTAFTKVKGLRLRLWMAARREATFLVHHPDAALLLHYVPGGTDRLLAALPDERWQIEQLDSTTTDVLSRARAWVVATPEQCRQVQAHAPAIPVEVLGTVIDPASLPRASDPRPGTGTVIVTGAADPWWADDPTIEVLWMLRRAHPALALRWLVADGDADWLARHDLVTAGLTGVEVTTFDDRGGLTGAGVVVRAADEPTGEPHLVAATLAGVPVLDRHGQFGTLERPRPFDLETLIEQIDRLLIDPRCAVAEGRAGAERLSDRNLDDGGTAVLDLAKEVTATAGTPSTQPLARLLGLVLAPRRLGTTLSLTVAAAELAALTAGVPASRGVPQLAGVVLSVAALAVAQLLLDARSAHAGPASAGGPPPAQRPRARVPSSVSLVGAFVALLALAPWVILPLAKGATAALVVLLISSLLLATRRPPPDRTAHPRLVADLLTARVLPLAFAMVALGGAGSWTTTWRWATAATLSWAVGAGARGLRQEPRRVAASSLGRRDTARGSGLFRQPIAWVAALEPAGLAVLLIVSGVEAWPVALLFVVLLALHAARLGDGPAPPAPGSGPPPTARGYVVWPTLAYVAVLAIGDAGWLWVAVPAVVLLRRPFRREVADDLRRCRELLPSRWRRSVQRRLTQLWNGPAGRAARWTGWRVRDAWRILRDAVVRAWWATYRAHWRVRHATVDPVINVTRRQVRRIRRRLRRDDRSPADP